MSSVKKLPLPDNALLQKYRQAGAYTDCYALDFPGAVSFEAYVNAFYSTPLFRTERFILKWAVSRPSTDEELAALAAGQRDSFAAWSVEDRAESQLLLCDFQDRTRSWLMVSEIEAGTRLFFGSAVVPVTNKRTGQSSMGLAFRALLGFHKLYSVALLSAAARRIRRQGRYG